MNIVAGSYVALIAVAVTFSWFPSRDTGAAAERSDRHSALDTTMMLAEAGRVLFYAEELSNDGTLSCASCHIPSAHFQDGYQVGLARTRRLIRNTPTLLNANRYESFFWDGRATTLHAQIEEPLFKSKVEMESNDSIMAAYIRSTSMLDSTIRLLGYGNGDGDARKFVVGALAQYVLSLCTEHTRYDAYRAGTGELTGAELRGLHLFNGKAQCASCHPAPNFTDNLYHDNGLYRQRSIVESYTEKGTTRLRLGMDYGRGNIVSGLESLFRFRTPSLYNVELTSPYMHNGTVPTLEAVVDFYARGGDGPDASEKALDLSREEKHDLVAFLKTLTDVRYAREGSQREEVSAR